MYLVTFLWKKVREVTLQRERDRQRQLQQIHVDRQVQNSKDLEAMEKFRQGLLLATGWCSSKKNMKLLPCKNVCLVFYCSGAWNQPGISSCQQKCLAVWRWNQLRTFYRFSSACKPRENIKNLFKKISKNVQNSFLGNKKLSLNQNDWHDQ